MREWKENDLFYVKKTHIKEAEAVSYYLLPTTNRWKVRSKINERSFHCFQRRKQKLKKYESIGTFFVSVVGNRPFYFLQLVAPHISSNYSKRTVKQTITILNNESNFSSSALFAYRDWFFPRLRWIVQYLVTPGTPRQNYKTKHILPAKHIENRERVLWFNFKPCTQPNQTSRLFYAFFVLQMRPIFSHCFLPITLNKF